MTSSTRERNDRLAAIKDMVDINQQIDRRALISMIVKRFQVSSQTAKEYIDDLAIAGRVDEKYGIVRAKVRA